MATKNIKAIKVAEKAIANDVNALGVSGYHYRALITLTAAIDQKTKAMTARNWALNIVSALVVVTLLAIVAFVAALVLGNIFITNILAYALVPLEAVTLVAAVISFNTDRIFPYAKRAADLSYDFASVEPEICAGRIHKAGSTFCLYDLVRFRAQMLARGAEE